MSGMASTLSSCCGHSPSPVSNMPCRGARATKCVRRPGLAPAALGEASSREVRVHWRHVLRHRGRPPVVLHEHPRMGGLVGRNGRLLDRTARQLHSQSHRHGAHEQQPHAPSHAIRILWGANFHITLGFHHLAASWGLTVLVAKKLIVAARICWNTSSTGPERSLDRGRGKSHSAARLARFCHLATYPSRDVVRTCPPSSRGPGHSFTDHRAYRSAPRQNQHPTEKARS